MRERNEIILNRYRKASELRELGISPFVYEYGPTHTSRAILEVAEELIESKAEVCVAGRMLQIRSFGRTMFFHLLDAEGKIQVYVKKEVIGEEAYERFKKYFDIGDIVGVKGEVFRTKTGEVTVAAHELRLLTKAMRPLPEKFHGLRDTELRYRQRYVDLIVNEEVRRIFRCRSNIISMLRRYLDERGYLEVETPMMPPVHGGASARPFTTYHNALGMSLYLRIAPELYLKRLLVGGLEKVYEINRNFRNEGISTQHNPEFTMLELYAAYWRYEQVMELVEDMTKFIVQELFGRLECEYQGTVINFKSPWRKAPLLSMLQEVTGEEFSWQMPVKEVGEKSKRLIEWEEELDELSAPELIMKVFEQLVEPQLMNPTFVTEFPKALSPLAKSKPDEAAVAERFELFVGGLEMANGYSELNDPKEQEELFRQQMELRKRGRLEAQVMDEDYIRALEYGMPPAGGLGVGIDRLVMLFTNQTSIREVILFPLMRPEKGEAVGQEEEGGKPGESKA